MQAIIIIGSVILLFYMLMKYKKKVGQQLLIAFLISLWWVSYSGIYEYTTENHVLFGVNLYPLLLWTLGLVLLREVYEKLKGNRFIKATLIYIVGIIALEYIGYQLLGIRLACSYRGLFNNSIMHAPTYSQIFYFIIGPIYLKITDYMGVK